MYITFQRLMTFLIVAVPVLGIATYAAETYAFLYATPLSSLITAFEHGYD